MKRIIILAFGFITLVGCKEKKTLNDFVGHWVQIDQKNEKEVMDIYVKNNQITIKMVSYGICPYVFEYDNAIYENGTIESKKNQYESGGLSYSSDALFEYEDGRLLVSDLSEYPCSGKINHFSKEPNPIDQIVGIYKMEEDVYHKNEAALVGNYGRFIEISKKEGNVIATEFNLLGSVKNYIQNNSYKYDENTNMVRGTNSMRDEYNSYDLNFTLKFEDDEIIREQEWWGFPDKIELFYRKE